MTTTSDSGALNALGESDCASVAPAALRLATAGARFAAEELEGLRRCIDGERDPGRRIAISHAYLALVGAEAGAAIAAGWIRGTDSALREGAFEALLDFGAAALGVLEELAADANRDVRWHAFEALCQLHAPEAITPLLAGLADKDSAIRWAASRGLAAAGAPALIPVLEALVRREPGQQFHRAVRRVLVRLPAPGHEQERAALVESLGHLTTIVESGPRAELLLLELRQ